ncbi:MAG: hypothetical protein ACK55Z_36280, partial [bacterium]
MPAAHSHLLRLPKTPTAVRLASTSWQAKRLLRASTAPDVDTVSSAASLLLAAQLLSTRAASAFVSSEMPSSTTHSPSSSSRLHR